MENKVLILMSTYNGELYLRNQIDSLLKQSISVDILIRDDGSQDATLEILKEYEEMYQNISMIAGKNLGFVSSFVELIKHAKGYKYYAFCDQDDIWMEDKIEVALTFLDKMNYEKVCVYGSCSLLVDSDMKGSKTTQFNRRGIDFYNIIIQNLMPGHSQVVNQTLIDFMLANPIDCTKIFVHDYWIALLAITFGEFYFDNNYHTYYRQHTNQSLGYGHGVFSWITERIKHVIDGAARQISRQDQFFYDIFKDKLPEKQKMELEGLLGSQKNICTRFKYLCRAHVYRQRKFETALFYILYLFGGYKI